MASKSDRVFFGEAISVSGGADIDMVPASTPDNNPVILKGTTGKYFIPRWITFWVTAANSLVGNVEVNAGTTPGGKEIMDDIELEGLNAIGKSFRVGLGGSFPAIAADATLDITVTGQDAGTSGTMRGLIEGEEVEV